MKAFKTSIPKLSVFLIVVISIVVFMATIMYVVEGGENGFTSIPQSIYWAVVTVTTVGYGDMVPQTFFGKLLSSIAMITGYAIIAVPTGILTVEMSRAYNKKKDCALCKQTNDTDASYCNGCGEKFE